MQRGNNSIYSLLQDGTDILFSNAKNAVNWFYPWTLCLFLLLTQTLMAYNKICLGKDFGCM